MAVLVESSYLSNIQITKMTKVRERWGEWEKEEGRWNSLVVHDLTSNSNLIDNVLRTIPCECGWRFLAKTQIYIHSTQHTIARMFVIVANDIHIFFKQKSHLYVFVCTQHIMWVERAYRVSVYLCMYIYSFGGIKVDVSTVSIM